MRRRSTRRSRLALGAVVVLLVLAGGYAAFWHVVAGRVESGLVDWAQAQRTRKIDLTWQKIRVGGFPLAIRIELEDAALRDEALAPSPQLRLKALSASARPWDFADWRLAAPDGLRAELAGAPGQPPLMFSAARAQGVVSVDDLGGATLWLRLADAAADAGIRLPIRAADAWISLPPAPPTSHTEPAAGVAVILHQLQLPAPVPPLGSLIDELAFGLTLKGALPPGPLPQSLAAWRDAGGTVELDNLRLKWGTLGATATGTLALDQNLQPIGGFSGAIEGYDQILTALVRNGDMRPRDAGLARLALTMLAKAGPDGRPEIATSFTIQNGEMYLGPAKLGPMPRIAWQ
jgi:hypothetical protein